MLYYLAQTNTTGTENAAAGDMDALLGIIGLQFMVALLLGLALVVLGVVLMCMLSKRLGHAPWWGLFFLVPLANFILHCYWAFSRSPNEEKIRLYRKQLQQMKYELDSLKSRMQVPSAPPREIAPVEAVAEAAPQPEPVAAPPPAVSAIRLSGSPKVISTQSQKRKREMAKPAVPPTPDASSGSSRSKPAKPARPIPGPKPADAGDGQQLPRYLSKRQAAKSSKTSPRPPKPQPQREYDDPASALEDLANS